MAEQFRNITPLEWHGQFNTLARAERYDRPWLLKGLLPELAENKIYIDLLRKEFDITMQARHPAVVGVVSLEYVEEMQSLCIVEEWVDGITLTEWLRRKPSTAEKLSITRQLLDTIAHCHRQGVVHRDLKPGNVMVTVEGQVKLLDFGLSDTSQYQTFKGAAGTMYYVAPEMLDGGPADVRSDIYSLGKLLEDIRLPRQFRHIAEKASANAPSRRYASAGEMNQALDETRRARRRWLLVAAAVLVFTALCVLAFAAGYNTSPASDDKPVDMQQLLENMGDSAAMARDTTLMAITVPENGLRLFYPKPGARLPSTTMSEDHAVDLGLSVLWAPFNIGNDGRSLLRPGALFMHGNRDLFEVLNRPTDIEYDRGDSAMCINGTDYDVAPKMWGGRWRTPTAREFEELVKRCRWDYVARPSTIPGYIVTGPSGKQIFMPLTGFRYQKHFYSIGQTGYYWTADYMKEGASLAIVFDKNMVMNRQRHFGLNSFAVRPVLDRH